jgi:PPOX class probable F420-dependent enzyme
MTDKAQTALDFCNSKSLAYIATTDPDGQPQVSPVWINVLDGKPAFNSTTARAKVRNLRRDPRISLAIVSPDDPYTYVEVQGTVSFTEEGADDHIDALAKKYLDADSYPFRNPAETRITGLIEPENYFGQGV